jgi:hypothetical protein
MLHCPTRTDCSGAPRLLQANIAPADLEAAIGVYMCVSVYVYVCVCVFVSVSVW